MPSVMRESRREYHTLHLIQRRSQRNQVRQSLLRMNTTIGLTNEFNKYKCIRCMFMPYVLLFILIMYKIISNNNGAFRAKTYIMEHS